MHTGARFSAQIFSRGPICPESSYVCMPICVYCVYIYLYLPMYATVQWHHSVEVSDEHR